MMVEGLGAKLLIPLSCICMVGEVELILKRLVHGLHIILGFLLLKISQMLSASLKLLKAVR